MEGEEAYTHKPKKPLPPILKFRVDHIDLMPEGQKNGKFVKEIWDALNPEIREEYENQYKKKYALWKSNYETWKTIFNIQDNQRKLKAIDIAPEKSKGRPSEKHFESAKYISKPKRPTPAIFKFRIDHLKEMPSGNNGAKYAKQLWMKISQDQRQKYLDQYQEEMEKWREDLSLWKMNNNHEEKVKEIHRSSQLTSSVKREEQEESASGQPSQKPKRPLPASFRYRLEKMEEIPKGLRGAKQFKQYWDSLNSEEREVYEQEYRKDLEKWQAQLKEWKNSEKQQSSVQPQKRSNLVSRGVQTQPLMGRKRNSFQSN